MSLNLFFLLLLLSLVGMYGYFKPLISKDQNPQEIPQIELESFAVYEIGTQGVERFFEGEEGKRFDDRYEVLSAKFSNNSKSLFESIRADQALYKNDFLTLSGNVHYVRADGLEFRSAEGTYDHNRSIIRTQRDFTITQNGNRVSGTKLYYNTERDTVSADAVRGSYQLD